MRILFLTQIIPYPPDSGPKVKTWHVLRYLVEQGHEVILASFVREEELQHLPALKQLCSQVHTVPIKRSRLADVFYMLQSNLTGKPFLIERDNLPGMQQLVRKLLAEQPIDIIHADQLTMTQFAFLSEDSPHPRPAWIFDAHNATWTIVERMKQNANLLLKPILAMETARVRKYEAMLVEKFDYTMAVTEPDRQALLAAVAAEPHQPSISPDRLPVIPIAVDTRTLQPAKRQPGSTNLLTLGTLHYPPNADGIRWFAQEVFPLIRQQRPEVTLTIAGKNPPPDFLELAQTHPQHLQVTGYVPDLTPLMEQAALMVVPVRAGGGMRVRILEAFARAMPVVTTTIGLEGIEAEPGNDVLVEDTAETFAAAVLKLLADPALQAQLAANGRKLAEQKYDWQAVLGKMNPVYASIAERQNRAV